MPISVSDLNKSKKIKPHTFKQSEKFLIWSRASFLLTEFPDLCRTATIAGNKRMKVWKPRIFPLLLGILYEVESNSVDMVEVMGHTVNSSGALFCEFHIQSQADSNSMIWILKSLSQQEVCHRVSGPVNDGPVATQPAFRILTLRAWEEFPG